MNEQPKPFTLLIINPYDYTKHFFDQSNLINVSNK